MFNNSDGVIKVLGGIVVVVIEDPSNAESRVSRDFLRFATLTR
jgi:hypothetical protein